jgi:hypothetical protein
MPTGFIKTEGTNKAKPCGVTSLDDMTPRPLIISLELLNHERMRTYITGGKGRFWLPWSDNNMTLNKRA